MKAIETQYKGYRFRSRLEARWAVYFDALGIEWEYEKEGFVLDDDSWYLPDFWLPQVGMWAEVKPVRFTEMERRKAEQLNRPCVLLVGVPDLVAYAITDEYDDDCFITAHYIIHKPEGYGEYVGRFYMGTGGCSPNYFPDSEYAVECALSARFEQGYTKIPDCYYKKLA